MNQPFERASAGGLRFLKPARLRACLTASFLSPAIAQQPPAWITEGPYLEQESVSVELPVTIIGNKIYVEVDVGGAPRRFVFDTGSPSMMRQDLALELGLEPVDRRQGRDAHGALVETKIVQSDMTLAGVTFHKVPFFAADFSASEAARCLIGDGVLGSEVLPLCAWQIDLADSRLRCETDLESLDHVDDAERITLYDFGYPHAPIFDVRFAKEASSKAMFDTGSPDYFTISPPDAEGTRKADGVAGTTAGYGSLGASLGGQAPDGEQFRVVLKQLSLGDLNLGAVDATIREAPPSLIGAAILHHFVITLDARSGAAWIDAWQPGPYRRGSFGFGLKFTDPIAVSMVWENSAASDVKLEPGQALTAINGQPAELTCDTIERALEAMSGDVIELEWDGGSARLERR